MSKINRFAAIAATMLLSVSIVALQSCKKDDDDPTPPTNPEITSISPGTAKVGETITITGKNFKEGTEGVSVTVEGVFATVSSAAPTSIKCAVPEVAVGPADIVVKVNTLVSEAYNSFEVLAEDDTTTPPPTNPMSLSGFTPARGKYDTLITLTGENFGTDKAALTVTVNGKEQEITSITNNQIVIKLAKKTFSGAVKVTKGTETVTAGNELTYHASYRYETLLDNMPGNDIAYYNNKYYISNNDIDDIIILDASFNVLDTLASTKIYSKGIFIDNTGMGYFSSSAGIICSFSVNDLDIDTLIYDTDPNIESLKVHHLTGDNNGALYLATRANNSLLSIDIDAQTTSVLTTDTDNTYSPVLLNNKLYYTTAEGLNSINVDGTGKETIINTTDGYNLEISALEYDSRLDQFYISDYANSEVYTVANGSINKVITIPDTEIDHLYGMLLDPEGDLLVVGVRSSDNLGKIYIE